MATTQAERDRRKGHCSVETLLHGVAKRAHEEGRAAGFGEGWEQRGEAKLERSVYSRTYSGSDSRRESAESREISSEPPCQPSRGPAREGDPTPSAEALQRRNRLALAMLRYEQRQRGPRGRG